MSMLQFISDMGDLQNYSANGRKRRCDGVRTAEAEGVMSVHADRYA
jgi:hypothetical protein